MTQLRQLLQEIGQLLVAAGMPEGMLEARVLAGHILGLSRVQLATEALREIGPEEEKSLRAAVARRTGGEPLAHITGCREFYGYNFLVTPQTLIPRPETELLVEEGIRLLPAGGCFADWGTGSGCIGISIAAEREDCRVLLLDFSMDALKTAQVNAQTLGVSERVRLIQGDMTRPCLGQECLDAIFSNPPYIAFSEVLDVMPEVRKHEPAGALFSEDEGLHHIHALVSGAWTALKRGGWLLLEHGAGQGASVRTRLARQGFKEVRTLCDLSGQERCTEGQK